MTFCSAESRVRLLLPATRFVQARLPLSVSRRLIKLGLTLVRLTSDIRREAVSADGVACEWLIPKDNRTERVLLYLHGGGFVFPLTPLHVKMVAYLVRKTGMRALLVDYRVAPEHPFPLPLDDCVTAYRWLLGQGFAPDAIVMAGDSAGGNLAITTMMRLRDAGDPLPAAAACLSPVVDLADRGSVAQAARDPLLPPKAVRMYNRSYVAQSDPRDPSISPAFGDWRGLPPLLVHAGEDEMLRDDAVRAERLAGQAGVDVRLEVYPRMWHVWQLYLSLPQATRSLDDIAGFLARKGASVV